MTFEELLPKPLDEMSEAELVELARSLDLREAMRLERHVKKRAKAKKPNVRSKAKKEKTDKLLNDLLAKGMQKSASEAT